MVIICNKKFQQEGYLQNYFEKYPFELSDFQKYAIEAITTNNHILITAHTGSGKTLPAEFAIEHLTQQNKKIIYTSPIKALSNQKFYELSLKFPNISFGILTGDIKFNPEAQVLIMTTEILRNTLLYKNSQETNNSLIQFQMDMETELGAVVFDEVHYINDPDRGSVWEESIMLLPPCVQMVMLSATIDNPEKFASWVEEKPNNSKKVYLAPTNFRVVPLIHYNYNYLNEGTIKFLKDKKKEFYSEIKEYINKPLIIKDNKKNYYNDVVQHGRKIKEYLHKNNIRISPKHILNQIVHYLNKNNMLPAICFVFSRKLVESYAENIETSLFEENSTTPSTIEQECRMILQKRISNYNEYIQLNEYQKIVKLLQKGIAIHHSGILPIIREMIELLFSKGYIKLLFATETFSVGLNMPTKTVIMSSFTKFNGSNMRYLFPHEYTQMAGRAGRRGIDIIGHVIHLNNLFDSLYDHEYNNLLNGNPLPLVSRYDISYNTLLTMIKNDETINLKNLSEFSGKSLISVNIDQEKNNTKQLIEINNNEYEKLLQSINYIKYTNNKEKISEFLELSNKLPSLRANQYKKTKKKIDTILEEKNFSQLIDFHHQLVEKETFIANTKNQHNKLENHFEDKVRIKIDFLKECKFIDESDLITSSGNIGRFLQEVPGLLYGKLLHETSFLKELNNIEIITLFSTFNNIKVSDDIARHNYFHIKTPNNTELCNHFDLLKKYHEDLTYIASKFYLKPYEEEPNYNIIEYIEDWCNASSEAECLNLIEKIKNESNIFLGEFIKAIIKINNIVEEMKKIAEYFQEIEFLNKLHQIPNLILKYVATNQSLYI